jgi:hypothetical protein
MYKFSCAYRVMANCWRLVEEKIIINVKKGEKKEINLIDFVYG